MIGKPAKFAILIAMLLLGLSAQDARNRASATSSSKLILEQQEISKTGVTVSSNANTSPSARSNKTAPESVIGVALQRQIVGRQVTLNFYLENLGTEALDTVVLTDDLDASFSAGGYTLLSVFQISGPSSLTINGSFDGSADTTLVSNGTIAIGGLIHLAVTIEVDTSVGGGVYSNQVTATASSSGGGATSDSSDWGTDPDPDGDGNPDEAGENDATMIDLIERPVIGAAKSAMLSGNTVTFDIYLESLGTSDLSNLSVPDDLDTVFGSGNYSINAAPTFVQDPGTITLNGSFDGSADADLITSGTLVVGAVAQIRFVVDITSVTDQGSGLGVYSNQVLAEATGPNGTEASDLSDAGSEPDADGDGRANGASEEDPTLFVVGEEPAIGLAQTASVSGMIVSFDLYLENLGDTDFSSVSLIENLDDVFGEGNYSIHSAPAFVVDPGTLMLSESFDGTSVTELFDSGTLAAGATAQIHFEVRNGTLSDQGSGDGVYESQGFATGATAAGAVVTDLSDSGSEPDTNGNSIGDESGENDATGFTVGEVPIIALAKKAEIVGTSTLSVDVNGSNSSQTGTLVRFTFILENLGNVTLSNVQITDDLIAVFGSGNFGTLNTNNPDVTDNPGSIVRDANYNGSTVTEMLAASSLEPGDRATILVSALVMTITDQGSGLGVYANQATASGDSPLSTTVSDLSDEGNLTDSNGNGDPTEAGEDDPTNFSLGSNLGVALDVQVSGDQVTFQFYLEAFGVVGFEALDLVLNLDQVFGAGNYQIDTAPFLVDDPGTITLDPSYDGTESEQLFNSSSTLAAGDTAQIQMVIGINKVVTRGNGVGTYSAQVTLGGTQVGGVTLYDASDSGTDPDPNGDSNPSGSGEGDATAISLAYTALVGVAHAATVVSHDVTMNYYLENFGAGTASSLSMPQNLDEVFGEGNYTITSAPAFIDDPGTITINGAFDGSGTTELFDTGSTLAAGDTAQIQMVVNVIDTVDLGAGEGIYSNQVTVTATDSNGLVLCDLSDSGTNADPGSNGNPGNTDEDNATSISLNFSAIGLALRFTVQGSQIIVDTFIENIGENAIATMTLTDQLLSVFGFGNYSKASGPTLIVNPGTITLNSSFDGLFSPSLITSGTLAIGGKAQIRYVINVTNVTDQGNGFGVYIFQATINATDSLGAALTDLSDDGILVDSNGNGVANEAGENDTSTAIIGEETSLGIALEVNISGSDATFDIYLENLGNVTASNLSVLEDLEALFGVGGYSFTSNPSFIDDPGTITLNPNYGDTGMKELISSGSLAVGDTAQIQFVLDISGAAGDGNYTTQAVAICTGPSGTRYADYSDDGTDPDANGDMDPGDSGEDDETSFSQAVYSQGIAESVSVSGNLVTFDYYIENFGNQTATNVSLVEDLDALFGSGNYEFSSDPVLVTSEHSLVLNPDFDGSTDTQILSGSQGSGILEQVEFVIKVNTLIDGGSGLGVYSSQATLTADNGIADLSDAGTDPDSNGNGNPDDSGEDDPTSFTVAESAVIGVAHMASVSGTTVTLDYYLENFGNVTLASLSLPEDLDSLFGAGLYSVTSTSFVDDPGTITLNAGFDGSAQTDLISSGTLASRDTAQIQLVVELSLLIDGGSGFGVYSSQVTASGESPGMVATSDLSDSGTNPDPNSDSDPTGTGENDATSFSVSSGTIGDFVWNDLDGDGVQDGGEPGLSGFTVYADMDNNGSLDGIDPSDTTDSNGAFDLTGLPVGSYVIRVDSTSVTSGFTLTGGTNPVTINLSAGGDDNSADFGYQQQDASIGDFVWNDLDGDGVQDGGETGISGVVVFIDSNSNGALDGGEPSDTTDVNGAYGFTGLPTGTYSVRIDTSTVTSGFVLTGGTNPTSVTLTAGEAEASADFGFQQQDATIGDFVWDDLDGDGVQDGGEAGLAGVTVFIDSNSNGSLDGGEPSDTTDANGAYGFSGLAAGTYAVRVDESTVTSGYGLTGGSNPASVTLTAGEAHTSTDFGYQEQDATIGDFVWNDLDGDGNQDGGEPGLSGVTVFVDLNSNGSLDGGEPSDTTDANGAYDLTGLALGTYSIKVDTSTVTSGFELTGGSNPVSVTIAAGEDHNSADFGFQQQDATIGDFVWNDLDGDGVQDGGEPGLSGFVVYADLNSNGSLDGGEPSDTTDANGAYDLTGLPLGTYSVRIDGSTVTTGFVLTGGSLPHSATIAAGEDYNDADFGYQEQDASIGNFVWNDLDGDGVQDGGESGFSGVVVFLDLNSNGTLDGGETSDTTDANGAYSLSGLALGTYSVRIDTSTLTSGFVLTGGTNPVSVTLTAGEANVSTDFGYQQQDATIGDFVWDDLDGDGVQDGGEAGLAGVTVFIDSNSNGSLDGGEPSDTTDANGAYGFSGLAAGTYAVRVDESTVTSGYGLTGGSNPASVTLIAGEAHTSTDFGYQQQDATISDFVWNDLDGDGNQDGGEPGLSGVTVFVDLNSNGSLDGGEPSDTTDANGAYSLTGLALGTYSIRVDTSTVTSGFELTGGSNPVSVTIAAGETNSSADFGFQQQDATIGDFVWNDLDGDGVQDGGETGLSGYVVFIDLNSNGSLDGGEPSDSTDANGAYDLTGLALGTYSIRIDTSSVTSGFVLTGGTSPQSVTIAAGEDYNVADFGYQEQDASIGNFVWNDLDGDGVQDGGETGLSGVVVYLDLNSNSTLDGGEPSDTTDANGAYSISNLATGTYSVRIDTSTVTSGFVLTGGTNPVSVTLSAGETNTSTDFGFQQQDATIAGTVWDDLNGDGVLDGGEPGIAGVTVFIDINTNGTLDGGEASDTTDINGAYSFSGFATGTYSVQLDESTMTVGYVLTGGTNPVSVTLAAGEDNTNTNLGYQEQDATIGDFVWNDLNGDGVQDGGEAGLPGVTVFIDSNSNGSLDGGETSTVTDANGAFDFANLATGTYSIKVDTTTVTSGFVLTGGSNPASVTIAAGEDNNATDFGFQEQDAMIGDFVWNDLNGDGVQDGGEPGIEGVVVFIDANSNGTLDGGESSTTTDADGAYVLGNLATGTYSVEVDETTVTTGFVLTGGTVPASVTLAAGEVNTATDFGYQQQDATVGDFVWNDLNGDGVQDSGESGLSGVTVFIDSNSNGTLDGGESSTTTDANGAYTLGNLALGTYAVQLDETTLPSGFVLTGGSNPASITLTVGEVSTAADFGYQEQDATIGDFVWNDLDGDGVQDGGEPGLAGVTLFIDSNSNGSLDGGEASTTTDANGAFDFTGLALGTYSIRVDTSTVTSGFVLTGGTNPVSVTIAAGEDNNAADFGFQEQDASIGDFVWNDLNGDGLQDGGETGLAGVTVFIDTNSNGTLDSGEASTSTDANGAYFLGNLALGTYSVQLDESTVTTGFVLTGGTNPVSVTLTAGEVHSATDFGYQQQDASIGDFVWNDLNGNGVQDSGEPGLAGVTVFIDGNSNGSLDGGERSTSTDANGTYTLDGFALGTYSVRLDLTSLPSGFVLTGGINPVSVTLTAGEANTETDFGFQEQDATIGDFVWNDLDGDGVQDGGEPGLAGVVVFIDGNSNGTLDGGELSRTTDANGAFDFTALATGSYAIRVDSSTVTSGFVLTGGTNPVTVTIAAGEDYNGADFGYQEQDATIGDFVWNDLNGDGVQDGGEPGLAGVVVFLDSNSNGTLDGGETSTTTDANGAFDFGNLPLGTYSVQLDATTVTTGFVQTGGSNPQSVTIAAGEDFNTADFGFQQQDASIGDFVWNDLNGDGVQDGGEPGLAGVVVFIDSNSNGSLDGGEASATTDANGAFLLGNLALGTYLVQLSVASLPSGFVLTGGTNPVSVTLTVGEVNTSTDFGYQEQDATIGDFLWNDLNGDGVQDLGEPGIAGVTLFLDSNSNGTLDGGEVSVTTDANGAFDFTGLATGTYSVKVVSVTSGFVLTGGTDPVSVTLAAGEDFNTADFGYQQQDATIGDFVWNDLNGDGVQDSGEPGLAGVVVFLDSNSNGTLDGGETSATTDANGAYDFSNLAMGTYSVQLDATTVTSGFVQTGATNPISVTIAAGEDLNNADFGFQQQDATIGDFVWDDLNGDGVQDGGEPGLAGVLVFVDRNSNGTLDGGEQSATTDANGAYALTDLALGTYAIMIDETTTPGGYGITGGSNPASVTLTAGEVNTTTDFGYQEQNGVIGDFVWNDLNGDGVQDGGEPGLAGYVLFLDSNSNGTLDGGESSTTSDANGAYSFSHLPLGTYTLQLDESSVTAGFVKTAGTNPIVLSLAANEILATLDFGFQQQDASIGDFVWNDLNGDGIQDAGEPGFANVTLFLDSNGNGVLDGEELVQSTDANGAYHFEALPLGTYLVQLDESTLPEGYFQTAGSNPATLTIAAGELFESADFGFQRNDASIGDLVWEDANNNGIQDNQEPGIAGVTLDLIEDLNGNGVIDGGEPVLASTTTDANGAYLFEGLVVGKYLVKITDQGAVLSGDLLTTGWMPYPVDLAKGNSFTSADFGYCIPPQFLVSESDASTCQDENITLTVEAIGSADLSYQWYKDGSILSGETTPSLELVAVQPGDSGRYTCTVSNSCGSDEAVVNFRTDLLSVSFGQSAFAQGLEPVLLEPQISCGFDTVITSWEVQIGGGIFSETEDPSTNPGLFPQTTLVRVHVLDQANGRTAYGDTLILVAQDPAFADLNGDGCNSIEDLNALLPEWLDAIYDANGDGVTDVLDFLYINLDGNCPN